MAVPKRRISNSRQGMRRSHHAIKPQQIQYCKNCDQPVVGHRMCSSCGHYKGREIMPLAQKDD